MTCDLTSEMIGSDHAIYLGELEYSIRMAVWQGTSIQDSQVSCIMYVRMYVHFRVRFLSYTARMCEQRPIPRLRSFSWENTTVKSISGNVSYSASNSLENRNLHRLPSPWTLCFEPSSSGNSRSIVKREDRSVPTPGPNSAFVAAAVETLCRGVYLVMDKAYFCAVAAIVPHTDHD